MTARKVARPETERAISKVLSLLVQKLAAPVSCCKPSPNTLTVTKYRKGADAVATCSFSVTFKGDIAKVLDSVKKETKKDGVEFNGDENKGTFHVKKPDIKGSYTVSKQKINFNIADHPWYASCSAIEDKVNDFFK